MGNYSIDPTVELAAAQAQGYVRVRFQQGKPMLDRELNLAADLSASQGLFANYLGNGIAAGTNGFAVSALNPATGDFKIAGGRALVNGLEAIASDTTYRTQPQPANVGPLPVGQSNVYLRVWTQEIGSAQDPALANPGDVTFETSVRDKVLWEVVVSAAAISQPDHLLLAAIDTVSVTVNDMRRQSLNLGSVRDDLAPLKTRVDASLDQTGALKPAVAGVSQLKTQSFTFSGALAAGGSMVVNLFTGNEAAPLLVNVYPTHGGALSWSQGASGAIVAGNIVITRSVLVHNDTGTAILFRCDALLLSA